ncbi:MAG: LytTR family DNA-binding domain-containing protein [Saprospiraceae bacterium]
MILKAQYPNSETNKEIILTSSIVGILLYLLLIIYQPFGTSQFEHPHKYLLLFPYAVITGFSFFWVNLLMSKQKRKWTIGSELFKNFLILLLISSLSYLYNTLFLSKVNLSFENYLYMFAYTLALALPVSAIYILARYIYLNNKNKPIKNTNISDGKSVIKSEKYNEIIESDLKQKLYIVSENGNFCIEVQQEDFVFAESADNYCIVYFYKNDILQKEILRISLTKLLSQIQTDSIKKVHRSFIVNLKKVNKLKGNTSGYKISIANIEKELTISRNYIDSILPVLENLAIHP